MAKATSDYLQVDLPDAASDIDIQGGVRIPVGVVYVSVSILLEALGVDLAEAAFGPHPHSHFAWHQHRCLAYPALYAGVETPSVVAGQVHRCISGSHLEVESRQGEAVQVALTCAFLHHEI